MLGQEKVTCIPNQPTDTVKKSILDIGAIVDKRKRFLDLHFLGQSAILEVGSKWEPDSIRSPYYQT